MFVIFVCHATMRDFNLDELAWILLGLVCGKLNVKGSGLKVMLPNFNKPRFGG